MKIRFGALEMEIETQAQLDELVMRYGPSTVVVVDAPVARATAGDGSAQPASGAASGGAPGRGRAQGPSAAPKKRRIRGA
jgi:hypothetical protein